MTIDASWVTANEGDITGLHWYAQCGRANRCFPVLAMKVIEPWPAFHVALQGFQLNERTGIWEFTARAQAGWERAKRLRADFWAPTPRNRAAFFANPDGYTQRPADLPIRVKCPNCGFINLVSRPLAMRPKKIQDSR